MSRQPRDRFFPFLLGSFLVAALLIYLCRPANRPKFSPASAPQFELKDSADLVDPSPPPPVEVDTADILITLVLDSEKLENGAISDWIRLVHVYDRSGKKIQTLDPGDNAPWTYERDLGIPRYEIEDMNFDGFDDFRVLNGFGSRGQLWFTFFLYNPATKKFEMSKDLEGLCDVKFDHETKTIFSNVRMGCCWEHESKLLAWENGALVLLKEENVWNDPADTTNTFAFMKVRKRVNGKTNESTTRVKVNDHLGQLGNSAWWSD